MPKRGLPAEVKMRHDVHYVDELVKSSRSFGRVIQIDRIEPNPDQPRTEIGDLTELANSIKEKGVLEPLLVRPQPDNGGWLIIAGERRWRAAQIAGLSEVPCVELNIDDQEVAEIALIENLQRKDLTVWEEADALAELCRRYQYTHEELARKIGKSRSSITESLSLANLPLSVRERCLQTGVTSKSQALQIARQFDENAMLDALERRANNSGAARRQNSNNFDQNGSESDSNSHPNFKLTEDPSSKRQPTKAEFSKFSKDSFPVRVFTHRHEQNEYKLEIKFKKPTDKTAIAAALKQIIGKLEEGDD